MSSAYIKLPYQHTTIYSDYVHTLLSLFTYPKTDMIEAALNHLVKRMLSDLKKCKQKDECVFMTFTATKPIDKRNIHYIDNYDILEDGNVYSN